MTREQAIVKLKEAKDLIDIEHTIPKVNYN